MIKKIMAFWSRLNAFETNNPDDARRGRLLNILLGGTFLLSILIFLATITLLSIYSAWGQQGVNLIFLALIICGVGCLLLLWLNQHSPRLAGMLFLLLLSTAFVFSDTPFELSNGRSSFVFFITIAVSSLILFPAGSFLFAIINTIIVIYLALISKTVPNPTVIAGFYLLALISWLSSRSLEQALRELRSINANLDKLVQERTQALAEALARERFQAGRDEAILNSIADGVIVFDKNLTSLLANPAIVNLLNMPSGNIVGQNARELLISESLPEKSKGILLELLENPRRTEESLRLEWEKKTLSVSAAPVSDAEGEQIGTVAVFRDFTREAEIERMKSTFVAIVSHELRTPLNAILGYAEMIKETVYGTINEKQKNATERIMSNTQRLLSIVSDLLDQAQIEAGKLRIKVDSFEPAELLESVHGVMDKITADANLKLSSNVDSALPENLLGDFHRLQQILINLINNSVKFTSEGEIQMHLFRNGQTHWGMEVRDTGVGIPEAEIPHIFETFRQVDSTPSRQYGGIGLGLAIVKQLVELMQGEIIVKSQQGQGSSFTIILPLNTVENSKETTYE